MATAKLYAWAVPVLAESDFRRPDHTWVTNYDAPFDCPPPPDYWYCFGACHRAGPDTQARLLGSASADLEMAKCICTPPSSHGGLRYGIDGVCHQLANRLLYATSPYGPPLTVKDAHGYWLSHYLYDTYGEKTHKAHEDWEERKRRCRPHTEGSTMAPMGGDEDPDERAFEQMVAGGLELAEGERADRLQRVRSLQAELLDQKRALDVAVQSGQISGEEFARQVNELVSSYLPRIAQVLGAEDTERIFNAAPGETVQIVDPEVAAQTDYVTGGGEPEGS